jgi:hypothetical protein
MRIGYADPPYVGQAMKHYGRPEVDHAMLIERLLKEYPDGWALSASSPSLRFLLPWCPEDVRIGAWVKPFHVFKKGVRPAYAWEPVLFRGGRNAHPVPPPKNGKATTPRDWVACNITLGRGLVGAKPEAVCFWIFSLLNLQPGDQLDDLYPGTGAVERAWELYRGLFPLARSKAD